MTDRNASKIVSRLAVLHRVAEKLQDAKKTPRDVSRYEAAKAYVEAARQRLTALAGDDPLTWFAIVAASQRLSDEQTVQLLADVYDVIIRARDLTPRRKAVLAELSDEERRAIDHVASGEDLDEFKQHSSLARERRSV
jgi:sulfite reductase beta subunit-like hemoprotein